MVMLDANIILRYLLNDDEKMANEAELIIKDGTALVTVEIIAEVVYVLKEFMLLNVRLSRQVCLPF